MNASLKINIELSTDENKIKVSGYIIYLFSKSNLFLSPFSNKIKENCHCNISIKYKNNIKRNETLISELLKDELYNFPKIKKIKQYNIKNK